MSAAKTSLNRLVACVLVSPPPSTLAESSAVLRRLQSFGPVSSFRKVPSSSEKLHLAEPDDHRLVAVFADPEALDAARRAGTFIVKVHENLPNPKIDDPYNVRFLQSRVQPTPKSMTCRVTALLGSVGAQKNILSSGFSPSERTRLFQSLIESDVPRSILDGVGVFEHNAPSHLMPTPQYVADMPNLATLYRSPARQSSTQDQDEPNCVTP